MKKKVSNFTGGIKGIRYCNRCCFPATMDDISFDKLGICKSCQSSEDKMSIDWKQREKKFRKLVDIAKKNQKVIMIVFYLYLVVRIVFFKLIY